ncbi:MAG: lanthionine synthetase LanC family protein [Polyangiaceae bacterium]
MLLRAETQRALRDFVCEKVAPELSSAIESQLGHPPSETSARIENASLALFACAELTRDAEVRENLRSVARRGMEYALHCDPDSGGLYEGLTGLVASHRVAAELFGVSLSEHIRTSLLGSVLADLEERAVECSKSEPATLEETYDLLHGWGGVLAMAQGEPGETAETLRVACERLLRSSAQEVSGYAYFRAHGPLDIEHYGEAINMGTAHGVGLLGPLLRSKALEPVAQGLVRLVVDVGAAAVGRAAATGSIFPASLPIAALDDLGGWLGARTVSARFGWCYGDPGIALVLARAHAVSQNVGFANDIERLVVRCAEGHRSAQQTLVVDASLCHGAAGNFHCLAVLYGVTRDERLLPALEFWANDVLAWSKNRQLHFLPERSGYEELQPLSLLGGWAGIALSIASGLGTIPATWDHVLCGLRAICSKATARTPTQSITSNLRTANAWARERERCHPAFACMQQRMRRRRSNDRFAIQ